MWVWVLYLESVLESQQISHHNRSPHRLREAFLELKVYQKPRPRLGSPPPGGALSVLGQKRRLPDGPGADGFDDRRLLGALPDLRQDVGRHGGAAAFCWRRRRPAARSETHRRQGGGVGTGKTTAPNMQRNTAQNARRQRRVVRLCEPLSDFRLADFVRNQLFDNVWHVWHGSLQPVVVQEKVQFTA